MKEKFGKRFCFLFWLPLSQYVFRNLRKDCFFFVLFCFNFEQISHLVLVFLLLTLNM